ncbi:MAG: hypothetical protein Q9204_007643, partial [Flavoplaca sp. TL-2023a]
KDIACVPPSALPTVTISDIGIGPADAQINICEGSFVLLLEVLHGYLQWSIVKTKGYVRPIILAMLAHYAEAFAAIPAVSKEIHALSEKGYIRGNARPTKDVKEDKSRQKIYAGLILDLPEWVQTHSAALIIGGSKSWVRETDRSNGVGTEEYPWDYLSGGVEGECSPWTWKMSWNSNSSRRTTPPPMLRTQHAILPTKSFSPSVQLPTDTMQAFI